VLAVGLLVGCGCLGVVFLTQTDTGKRIVNQGVQITDEQRILGKWRQDNGAMSLEFFPDGTLREERALNTGKGTYKILPGKKLELKIEGVLWGTNEALVRYDITGDEFTISPDAGAGLTLRYRKVK
jgi:hypothetical protein